MTSLLRQARRWAAQDPDSETRTELEGIIEGASLGFASAWQELHSRFDTRLEFGTAGLRGELGGGPNRMNRVLVAQAAGGLAAYVRTKQPDDASVVIGYDGRKNSEVFARDTAEIMAGAGVRAILLPRMLPTPLLAFAVRHLKASAGVMVTASHNPARDNGYKVYLGGADGGSQIVPPADGEIAAHIERVARHRIDQLPRSSAYEIAGDELVDEYVAATAAVAGELPEGVSLGVVYTPLHGVGLEVAERVLGAAGLPQPAVVAEQADPDPTFPTVAFPNPEEPGALDLAFVTAREVGAELVIANDPDADRLAVAIPDDTVEGGWRRLSGNEVGLLLGWAAAQEYAEGSRGRHARGALASSIVSSPGLAAIAEAWDVEHVETLTGFKWISRVPGLVYGYEEALGYLVNPEAVHDKDGISAATRFLSLALRWKAMGLTVADSIRRLGERIGFFESAQISIRVTDPRRIGATMARLRAAPPSQIGELKVAGVDDLAEGSETLPAADILRYRLVDGSRVMVRPSGTEPKLKAYLDVRGDTAEEAYARLAALDTAVRELLS